MHTYKLTYEDFNGNTVTETLYFNLTKIEVIRMQVGPAEGLQALLEKIIAERNNAELFKQFEIIVLASYGIREEDGKKFIKNDEIREAFKQTAAYDALMTELMFSETALANFIKAVVPKDLAAEYDKQAALMNFPPPPPIQPA